MVREILAGNRRAREEFAERMRCVPRTLSALNHRRGKLLQRHELEDLSQDTVVKILEKLENFPSHATLEFWAHRFCTWEYMNRIRRQSRRKSVPLEEESPMPSTEEETPPLDGEELQVWLDRLGSPEADTIRLKLFVGKDFDAIGRSLGVPAATVKSRYYRGIKWLQERLAQQEERIR